MLIDWLESGGLFVDYCDVFISCLDSQSDGTHSLNRCKWRNAKFIQICSDKETNLDGLRMSKCQHIYIFGWTVPLNKTSAVVLWITVYISLMHDVQGK